MSEFQGPEMMTWPEVVAEELSHPDNVARMERRRKYLTERNHQITETSQWSMPAAEQTITMPGLVILATLNADGTVTVEIDANKGTVQRIAINDKAVF